MLSGPTPSDVVHRRQSRAPQAKWRRRRTQQFGTCGRDHEHFAESAARSQFTRSGALTDHAPGPSTHHRAEPTKPLALGPFAGRFPSMVRAVPSADASSPSATLSPNRQRWLRALALLAIIGLGAAGIAMAASGGENGDDVPAWSDTPGFTSANGLPKMLAGNVSSAGSTVVVTQSASNRPDDVRPSAAFLSTDSGATFEPIEGMPDNLSRPVAAITDERIVVYGPTCGETDTEDQLACRELEGWAIQFSPDGTYISKSRAPKAWTVLHVLDRVPEGPIFETRDDDKRVLAVQFGADGTWTPIATPEGTEALCDSPSGAVFAYAMQKPPSGAADAAPNATAPNDAPVASTIPATDVDVTFKWTGYELVGNGWRPVATAPMNASPQDTGVTCTPDGGALATADGRIDRVGPGAINGPIFDLPSLAAEPLVFGWIDAHNAVVDTYRGYVIVNIDQRSPNAERLFDGRLYPSSITQTSNSSGLGRLVAFDESLVLGE